MDSEEQNASSSRDQVIVAQQHEIEEEIRESIPLISDLIPLSNIKAANCCDDVITKILEDLSERYKFMRRTRPDGNCFFRGIAYAFFEYLIDHKDEFKVYHDLMNQSKEKLVQLGFPVLLVEDFHETFMDVIRSVDTTGDDISPDSAKAELHRVFNDHMISNYIVFYLRLLTSGKLQEEADFYQHFIEGDYTLDEFRRNEVEPMFKESDHIHIIALCTALNVGVRIEYMDRGDGGSVKTHDLPEGQQPKMTLIYRPGHYDILYPN